MKREYVLSALSVASLSLLTAAVAHASCTTSFCPLADIGGGSSKLADLYSSGSLSSYINKVFTFAIALGAIAAVLRLAYAGYLYMGSSDMWSSKGEARKVISDVTLGLLLLLAIWLILNQINPDITSLNALKSIKPVQQQSSSPSSVPFTSQRWCITGGSSCYDTEAACNAARSFIDPPCLGFK